MNYDPKPMAVVISNSLDPVVQRQLYAGIRADIMTADQMEEQHEDQQTIQESIPEPDVSGDVDDGNDINGEESSDTPQTDEAVEGDDDNTSTGENSDEPAEDNSDAESSEESSEDEDDADSESEEDPQEEASESADEGTPTEEDSESDSEGSDEADLEEIKSGTGFEAYFAEDAEGEQEVETEETSIDDQQQVIKSLFFIRADSEGLTPEQENLPGVITKPKDAIVVIDKTEVPNLEVGKQLTDLENRLVGMGVTVKDNIQEAIELINEISDGIKDSSDGLSQEGFMSKLFGPGKNPKETDPVKMLKALAGVNIVDQPKLRTDLKVRLGSEAKTIADSDTLFKTLTEELKQVQKFFNPAKISKFIDKLEGLDEDDYKPSKHDFNKVTGGELSTKVIPGLDFTGTSVTVDNVNYFDVKLPVDGKVLSDLVAVLQDFQKVAPSIEAAIDDMASADIDSELYNMTAEGLVSCWSDILYKVVPSVITWIYSYVSVVKVSNEDLFDSFRTKPKSNLTLAQKVAAISKALAGDAVVNRNLKVGVAVSRTYADDNRHKLPTDFIDKVVADFEVIKHVFTPTNVSKYLKGVSEVMKREEEFFDNLDLRDMGGALSKFKGKTFDKVAGAWVKSKEGKVPVLTLGLVTQPNPLIYQDGSLASQAGGFITDVGPLELHEIEALLNVFEYLEVHERLGDCDRMFSTLGNAGHAVGYYLVESLFQLLDEYSVQIANYIDWAYQSVQTK